MRLKSLCVFLPFLATNDPISRKRSETRRNCWSKCLGARSADCATSILPTCCRSIKPQPAPTGTPTIRVAYSESMSTSVLNPANYVLLGSSGISVPIDSVAFDPLHSSNSAVLLTYNGGAANPAINGGRFVHVVRQTTTFARVKSTVGSGVNSSSPTACATLR